MYSRRLLLQCSVIAVICTAAIFLFPVANGSFTSTHGPVTVLRAWRVAVLSLVAVALTATAGLGGRQWLAKSSSSTLEEAFAGRQPSRDPCCVLRC